MNDHEFDSIMNGIKGIHNRLDKLNGRVYAHEQDKADRSELREVLKEVKANRVYIWKITLLLATLVGGAEIIKWLM